jgi:hypothetical protein
MHVKMPKVITRRTEMYPSSWQTGGGRKGNREIVLVQPIER